MDVVKAAPDGYTLGYGNIVSLAINRSLLSSVPYDVERDLTLVSNCVQVFNFLAVSNSVPVRTVAELIAYAKQNPGKLTNGSSGNGTTGHLGGELFKAMAGRRHRACALQGQRAGDQRPDERTDPGHVRQRPVHRTPRSRRACARHRRVFAEAHGEFPGRAGDRGDGAGL
jgi:hypothetical protein